MEWLLLTRLERLFSLRWQELVKAPLQMPRHSQVLSPQASYMLPWGWLFHSAFKHQHTISPPSPFSSKALEFHSFFENHWLRSLFVTVFKAGIWVEIVNLAFVVGRWLLGNKDGELLKEKVPSEGKVVSVFWSSGLWVSEDLAQRPLSDFSLCKAWHNRKK